MMLEQQGDADADLQKVYVGSIQKSRAGKAPNGTGPIQCDAATVATASISKDGQFTVLHEQVELQRTTRYLLRD